MLYYLSLKAAPLPQRVILEPLIDTFLQNQSAFYNILALQTLSPQYHNNNCVCRIELLTSTRRFVILIVSYVKALVIDFNQEKALVRAFSVIVKTLRSSRMQCCSEINTLTDYCLHTTENNNLPLVKMHNA